MRRLFFSAAFRLKEFYWTVTRALGLEWLHDGSFQAHRLLGLLFHPIYKAAAWSLEKTTVRFLDAKFEGRPYGVLEHIGHCAMDFDSYLKDQILRGREVTPVFLCAGRKPANDELLRHWSKHIRFVRGSLSDTLLRPFMAFPKLVDSVAEYTATYTAARVYHVQREWSGRPPLLRLSQDEIARGEAQLTALGVPKGAWFVCVHSRDGGYIPGAEWQHSFRNSDIGAYMNAVDAIHARGGWCVRVGDPAMLPIEPRPGIIDYVHTGAKSAWMDVFLCSQCRFFLGNTSGLFGLASIFGRPSALANMAPLGIAFAPYPGDLSIPKLVRNAQGRLLSFPEAFADEASGYRHTPDYVRKGWTLIDNTPNEVAELAEEMMTRGSEADDKENDERQALFYSFIEPHHYCWRASSRIGCVFLRRHAYLLTDPALHVTFPQFPRPF